MYLSRLQLNPAHPQARRDLASAYELHRSLARAFAPGETSPPKRFLWRREADRSGMPGATVLVQSAHPGDWSTLERAREIGTGYFEELKGNKSVALQDIGDDPFLVGFGEVS